MTGITNGLEIGRGVRRDEAGRTGVDLYNASCGGQVNDCFAL